MICILLIFRVLKMSDAISDHLVNQAAKLRKMTESAWLFLQKVAIKKISVFTLLKYNKIVAIPFFISSKKM